MGRTKEHHTDTQHNNRRGRMYRRKIFYKQPAGRDRRNSKGSAWTLDGRELSLALGCDIPGGWKPYVGEAGVI